MIITNGVSVQSATLRQSQTNETVPQEAIAASSGVSVTVTQISPTATKLAALFDEARQYIQKEHIEPFQGYEAGNITKGAYLNVKKINDYVFDKAADTMITQATAAGITLNKDDLVAQLKSTNSDVASLNNDETARKTLLGDASVLAELSYSDMDNLTSIYIAAKEKGLDTSAMDGLAGEMGISNKMHRMGVVYFSSNGSEITDAAVNDTPNQQARVNAANNLSGKFGLSNFLINTLMAADLSGADGRSSIISFLKELLMADSQPLKSQ